VKNPTKNPAMAPITPYARYPPIAPKTPKIIIITKRLGLEIGAVQILTIQLIITTSHFFKELIGSFHVDPYSDIIIE